ncbi:MAG: MotA/TolQ/ExbB proton channel family protein [Planctomycetota bacterium]|nr:MotA/TolQ/ExbB proton channel family protein [Planctomycetota bacterium]MDA1140443.1 MotA/TolQ/ExbB proton channel family protein [Planctomycetota bacterium]
MFDVFHAFRTRWMAIAAMAVIASLCAEDAPKKPVEKGQAPKIVYVEPNHSAAEGGVIVTIAGENFRMDSKVFFGDAEVTEVKIEKNGTILKVTSPPSQGVGPVDVKVVNPDSQQDVFSASYFYGKDFPLYVFQAKRSGHRMLYFIKLGGKIMYPIIFLSFVTMALFFHCLLSIRESHLIPKRMVEDVMEYLANGHWDNAAEYCRKKKCAFGRVVLAGVQKADQSPELIREAMGSAGSRESELLQQKISYLNNVGVIAPMLGLFGTVWGLQLAFRGIAGEAAQHKVLAASISIALNTTVAGLFVGILAFVVYFLFKGKVVRLVGSMEVLAEQMAERIIERKGAEE